MNCEYVDELLPLFVGRDLDEERSLMVAAHLQSCTRCACAAEGYSEGHRWLQEFEPPPVSQAVYAGIRRQVLDEVARGSRAPAWPSIVSQFFGPLVQSRAVWIAATLLLAMLVGALFFMTQRPHQERDGDQIAHDHRSVEQGVRDPEAGIKSENNQSEAPSSSSGEPSGLSGSAPGAAGDKRRKVGAGYRSRPREARVAPVTSVAADPDVSPALSVPAPVRVEMQTSDPRIRIIWISGQDSQKSQNNSSKGF